MKTKAEMEGILNSVYQNAEQTIANSGCLQMFDRRILRQQYVSNGEIFFKCRCTHCGKTWVMLGSDKVECPDCGREYPLVEVNDGKDQIRWSTGHNNSLTEFDGNDYWKCKSDFDHSFVYLQELDNGYALIVFTVNFSVDNDINWEANPISTEIKLEEVIVFDKDYGYIGMPYLSYKNSDIITNDVSIRAPHLNTQYYRDAMKAGYIINKDSLSVPLNTWIKLHDERKAKIDKELAEKKAKKGKTNAQMLEEARQKFVPKNFDHIKDDVDFNGVLFVQTGETGSYKKFMCRCLKCGTDFPEVAKEDTKKKCPNCGREFSIGGWYVASSDSKDIVTFENTNLPENDLLIRDWWVNIKLTMNSAGKLSLTRSIEELSRTFCGSKMVHYENESDGTFKKVRPNAARYRCGSYMIQSVDEICSIVENSCLHYSGLLEAYGFKEPAYKGLLSTSRHSFDLRGEYLKAWYKNRSLGCIVRGNLPKLALDIIKNPDSVKLNDNVVSPCNALNVSKTVYQIASDLNLSFDQIQLAQALWEDDNSITAKEFKDIKNPGVDINIALAIKKDYGIPAIDTIKYMQSVYKDQCIEKSEALAIWKEYLSLAKKLGIDLTNRNLRFPSSLKKEYDILMSASRKAKLQKENEAFEEVSKQNAAKYGNFENEEFIVVVPTSPDEIIKELETQKIFTENFYPEQITEGWQILCFIRKKEDPDEPYVIVKISRNNEIYNITGYRDFCPQDKELKAFVKDWAKSKGITIVFH